MKIKIGDIFYRNNGIASFYQVVQVYESGRVRIREIEKEETPTECGYEFLAKPILNKFKPKKEYDKMQLHYADIKDNDKGTIKLVQKFEDGTIYINFSTELGYLYKKPVISSYWSVWMR